MVLASSSDQRTYFIDNMIGLAQIPSLPVCAQIEQELTSAPYSGAFLLYMIQSDFSQLPAEGLERFEKCVEGVSELEMKVLGASSASMLRAFIK